MHMYEKKIQKKIFWIKDEKYYKKEKAYQENNASNLF